MILDGSGTGIKLDSLRHNAVIIARIAEWIFAVKWRSHRKKERSNEGQFDNFVSQYTMMLLYGKSSKRTSARCHPECGESLFRDQEARIAHQTLREARLRCTA